MLFSDNHYLVYISVYKNVLFTSLFFSLSLSPFLSLSPPLSPLSLSMCVCVLQRTALYLVYWQSSPKFFNKHTVINIALNSLKIVQQAYLNVNFHISKYGKCDYEFSINRIFNIYLGVFEYKTAVLFEFRF